jgi:hypothetical protein
MRPLALIFLIAILCASSASVARERPFIDEPEPATPSSVIDKDTSWKEGETTLPPWPKDGDLVEFQVDDPSSPFRQYIDGRNITVGRDGAVRYTLVIESRSGARNVSFEGLRCTPQGSFRIFAYGSNGRFVETDDEWRKIQGLPNDKIHRDLHKLILCIPRKFKPRSKKDMIRAMSSQSIIESDTGFRTD